VVVGNELTVLLGAVTLLPAAVVVDATASALVEVEDAGSNTEVIVRCATRSTYPRYA